MLIKRYSSNFLRIEMRKFRNGYHLIVKELENNEWEDVYRHERIRALDRASNLMVDLMWEWDPLGRIDFKIYSKH